MTAEAGRKRCNCKSEGGVSRDLAFNDHLRARLSVDSSGGEIGLCKTKCVLGVS